LKQRTEKYEFAFLKESGHKVSIDQHSGIVRALRKNDLDRAVDLLRENWNIGPRFLLPWLNQRLQSIKPTPPAMRINRVDGTTVSV
jgi:DNA-binding GntR family transcriptional regulator